MATIDSVKLPNNSTYDLTDNYSGYAKKVAGATTDDLASLTATGDLADSGKKLSDLVLKSDVKDVLNSTSTTDPLSANMGRALADNLAANENVYGAKNFNSYPYYETTKNLNGITFTDNGDGTITVSSGTASAATVFYCHYFGVGDYVLEDGNYIVDGCPSGGSGGTYCLLARYVKNDNSHYIKIDTGNGIDFSVSESLQGENKTLVSLYISIENGTVISTPITFKPMIRDARILDPTFAPYAETNLQLTQNKAERNDLSTIHATGSTNTTGSTITAGTFFYLNGQFCKALTNIAANATFTENTNYKKDTVGGEIETLNTSLSGLSVEVANGTFQNTQVDTYEDTGITFQALGAHLHVVLTSWISGKPTGLKVVATDNSDMVYETTGTYAECLVFANVETKTFRLYSKRGSIPSSPNSFAVKRINL